MANERVDINVYGSLLWHDRTLPGIKWVDCRLGGMADGDFGPCNLNCPFLYEHKGNNHTVTLNCGPREIHFDVHDDERKPKVE